MNTELKWITPNAQDMIVYIARVSNPKSQEEGKEPEKLIKYLIKHRHWSPFEMASACFGVETTRDISRQIIRHQSQNIVEGKPFHIQEFSQRYADPSQLGFVFREARMQDPKNRQASTETEDRILQEEWREWQRTVQEVASSAYRWAVGKGIAKEQARVVLPEGMTPSRIYLSATIRDWIHYCAVRCGDDAQKEHRLIARDIWAELTRQMPAISTVLDLVSAQIAADARQGKIIITEYTIPNYQGIVRTEEDIERDLREYREKHGKRGGAVGAGGGGGG